MKVHCINILLFALPLNILLTSSLNAHNNNKSCITPCHTQINRSLCECELHMPNYDNDPQMKEVMEIFNKQTQQRFQEYDDRMKTTRQKCKDRCDKEIQKIILKDKLEKQMAQQLTTLETKIDANNIPTCIFEKSMADKVEKGCLRCGGVFGGGVMPGLGLIGVNRVYILANYNIINEFIGKTIQGLNDDIPGMARLFGDKIAQIVTPETYDQPMALVKTILTAKEKLCACSGMDDQLLCKGISESFTKSLPSRIQGAVDQGVYAAKEMSATPTTPTTFLTNPIILSAIAIFVIVLVMVIIYLILRYRRKKKMKKKLQYIKLLEE
ncbi:rifin PIR protein, putative [Plasmodium sp. DRC-Itaito]|nr:rifin PIR protein, putative [Plasmodium sp. DRC-Itaito]